MGLRRGFCHAVVGLSGGVDSAVTAALCARAFGPENVTAFLMPYRTSSAESEEHAQLVVNQLGINSRTIEITGAVDGYLDEFEPEADPRRRGNVMARTRMIVLFDQAAKLGALPVGTGNKSERLLGYFTWHADDSPPINPIGDLFKTQVWDLARHLGLPTEVIDKPASADLIVGQTDEHDLGVSYTEADLILLHLLNGRTQDWPADRRDALVDGNRGVVPETGRLLGYRKSRNRSCSTSACIRWRYRGVSPLPVLRAEHGPVRLEDDRVRRRRYAAILRVPRHIYREGVT